MEVQDFKIEKVNEAKIAARPTIGDNFEWIDILRGLAAFGVVLFHSRVDLWVGWTAMRSSPDNFSSIDKITAWLSLPLPFLGSTVMLFFILSGYCIHHPLALSKEINIRSYAIRRILRILPPYLAAVALSLFVEWICKTAFSAPGSSESTIWKTIFMVQNYPPNDRQLESNPSFWSLPVELELYIVYPVIFWLGNHIGRKFITIFVLIVSAIALALTLTIAPWLEGNFAKYWIIWCAGAGLAHLVRRDKLPKWRNWFWIPMIAAFTGGIIMTINNQPYVINHFIWAFGYFFLFWFCLCLPTPKQFLPDYVTKILFDLGKTSYSLYLIHFPLFRLLGEMWIEWHGTKPSNFIISLAASVLAVLVSQLFYKLVEQPAHVLAKKLGKKNQ